MTGRAPDSEPRRQRWIKPDFEDFEVRAEVTAYVYRR